MVFSVWSCLDSKHQHWLRICILFDKRNQLQLDVSPENKHQLVIVWDQESPTSGRLNPLLCHRPPPTTQFPGNSCFWDQHGGWLCRLLLHLWVGADWDTASHGWALGGASAWRNIPGDGKICFYSSCRISHPVNYDFCISMQAMPI